MTSSLPQEWQTVCLGDVCEIRRGASPRPIHDFIHSEGMPWVKIADATNDTGRFLQKTKQYIKEEGISKSVRVYPEDLIVSNSATPGLPKIMKIQACIHDGWLKIDVSESVNKIFLYYWFTQTRQFLASQASGTVFNNLKTDIVKALSIQLPPLEEQKRIADVLSCLDDKIENCRRMNDTLEAMARTLFKSWFVDFDPTHKLAEYEAGKSPYEEKADLAKSLYMDEPTLNLFPSTFDENGIPAGWEAKPLDQIADFLNGLALQKFPAENDQEYLPVIKIAELRNGISQKTNKASVDIPEKYIVKNGDLIFSWSATLMQKIWSEGDGALNQHLFKVTSEQYDKWFCYMWIDKHLPEFRVIASSKTTTMGHIQRKHLTEAKVAIPNDEILKMGTNTIGNMLDTIYKNELEIQTLTKTRTTLLPKLINGEIRV